MRKNTWPLAKMTFVALLCLQLVTLVVMLMIAHFGSQDAYLAHIKRLMRAVATESIQNVDSLLSPAENLVSVSASFIRDSELTNGRHEALEKLFFHNIRVNTNYAGMYLGWNNGDFLFVTRSDPNDASSNFLTKIITRQPDGSRTLEKIYRDHSFVEVRRQTQKADYDPRERPWYKAFQKGALMWTQPYIYHTSQQPGVTVSIPVVNNAGETQGVLGLDIEVANLSDYLSDNELSANSLALIATNDDQMVAHTDLDLIMKPRGRSNDGHRLATLREMNDDFINAALAELQRENLPFVSFDVRSIDFDHNDQRHHAIFHSYNKHGVNWTVVVISPESDFMSSIRQSQYEQIVLAVIGSLLLTLVAFLVALRFLSPVKELQESVLRNSLTGLYNRRALDDLGQRALEESQQKGQVVSTAMIDIDRFKAINDNFGHPVGDEVLIAVSQRMQQVLKKTDLLFRYGGEEFALLLFGADESTAINVCERLNQAVKNSNIQTESGGIPVTISIGVAQVRLDDASYKRALGVADKALFTAKRNGRDQVCASGDIDTVVSALTP